MQTFLPYPNFQQSAGCLDNHRLGKQRIETLEILVILKHVLGDGQRPHWMSHIRLFLWGTDTNVRCGVTALLFATNGKNVGT